MSDHRFSLDVKLSIYGQEFEWHPWLNWNPNGDSDVDQRIIDWFSDCYWKARCNWDEAIAAHEVANEERQERDELARLKAKYEGAGVSSGTEHKENQ